jgi:hypothetical protein
VGWNCHSWLVLPEVQVHCWAAMPSVVPPLVASTHLPSMPGIKTMPIEFHS